MKQRSFKKIIAMLLLCTTAFSFAACKGSESGTGDSESESGTVAETNAATEADTEAPAPTLDREINIAVLAGPTGMGAAKLMADNDDGKTENKYNFTVESAPDAVGPSLLTGEYDIAAISTNLAATLYNKKAGSVKVIAVNTGGVLYILENGNTVKDVSDLAGKKLYATGQAAVPEYVLNYILKANGVEADIEYLAVHSELATLLASGDAAIGMLPEPNVTAALNNGGADLRIALNLTEEWDKVSEGKSSLLQGCIVVNSDFAEKYPEAVEAFLREYKASVDYTNENRDEAAALIASYGIVPSEAVAKKALPNCNILYLDGAEMKTQLSGFLQTLFDADPKSVGGAMPGDDFYYGAN